MTTLRLSASYYQQFHADFSLPVPAEGYGGWRKSEVEICTNHTALAVMHAWDFGTREQFPGWHRAVEYIPRANAIMQNVFPPLLAAVRASPMRVYHVVRPGAYARKYPGFQRAAALAGHAPAPECADSDPTLAKLRQFRQTHSFVGVENAEDVERGFRRLDFPDAARPQGAEGVAEDERQLFALCKADGINHLIYVGFALDGCLLMSPGGMVDMSRRGVLCSTVRQAVTAIENKQTAATETAKQIALWRVAVMFGFVFETDDLISALARGT